MHRKAETTTQAAETTTHAKAAEAARREDAPPAADLDLEALDLSIETVEERISPSETNVFDK